MKERSKYISIFLLITLVTYFSVLVFSASYDVFGNSISAYIKLNLYTSTGGVFKAFPVIQYVYVSTGATTEKLSLKHRLSGYVACDASLYDIPSGQLLKAPDDPWYDCNYPYRKPYLYDMPSGNNVSFSIEINDGDILGNVSTGKEVLLVLDSVKLNFTGGVAQKVRVKVGIKPSSFGGTGDYVMIRVNGTWIHPDSGTVEEGVSGDIVNATFTLGEGSWIIEAVGLHHTSSGWSDPTDVYIWNMSGALLHQYTASSHTWDNSIYDGTNYFEYVTIDNYQVDENNAGGVTVLNYDIYIESVTSGYHELYVYYGVTGVDNSLSSPPTGYTAVTPSLMSKGNTQLSGDFGCTTTTTTTTTTTSSGGGGGGGAPPVITTTESPLVTWVPQPTQGGNFLEAVRTEIVNMMVVIRERPLILVVLGLALIGLVFVFAGLKSK